MVLLRRRNRLVEQQRSELAELNATKDRLFSIIGHDLRSPLHSLHVFVELLAGPPLPPAQLQEYTGHLTHTLDQTLLLLENLLSWAALQMQAASPPRPVPQALSLAVADAFDLVGPAAEAAGLHLHNTLAGTEWVLADPAAVRLVLRNLLSNALKFTSAGGQITVSAERRADTWHLAVADTGRGLPAAIARQPLQPGLLPQADTAPSRAPGAGLGLALCQDYARRNGGELEVSCAGPGQGATFYLVLPAGEAVGW
ncbi:MAG: sensor histidine kinase [Janthinobacterium lividum]